MKALQFPELSAVFPKTPAAKNHQINGRQPLTTIDTKPFPDNSFFPVSLDGMTKTLLDGNPQT